MTQKNYKQFAEMLRVEITRARNAMTDWPTNAEERAEASGWMNAIDHVVTETADIFESENGRFNRDKFFAAVYTPRITSRN